MANAQPKDPHIWSLYGGASMVHPFGESNETSETETELSIFKLGQPPPLIDESL